MNEKLTPLMRHLGYTFQTISLLEAALSHRSLGSPNNERLEFLGDSILSFTMAAELFARFPNAREGELTQLRACLVNGEVLATIASEVNLGKYLRLGAGELKSGGFRRKSILADAFEAIIGAIYLDADLATCQGLLLQWFASRLDGLTLSTIPKDAKTRLQEYTQSNKLPLPEYTILTIEGKMHAQTFHITCKVQGIEQATQGVGNSRRLAEQQAAEKLLTLLQH